MRLTKKIKIVSPNGLFYILSGSLFINLARFSYVSAATPVSGSKDGIFGLIQTALNIIFSITGFVIIGMVIAGGIQYSTAGGSPQKASEAKKKISNAVLSLILMVFLYPFLQWLVPGGIFG